MLFATNGTLLAATLFMALSTAHLSTRAHQVSQWVAFCVYNLAIITVVISLVTLLITFGDLSFFMVIKSVAIIYILLLVPGVLYINFLRGFFKTRAFGTNASFRSGGTPTGKDVAANGHVSPTNGGTLTRGGGGLRTGGSPMAAALASLPTERGGAGGGQWENKAIASFTASHRDRSTFGGTGTLGDDPYGIGGGAVANGGPDSRPNTGNRSTRHYYPSNRPGTVAEVDYEHEHDNNDIGLSIPDDSQFKRYCTPHATRTFIHPFIHSCVSMYV